MHQTISFFVKISYNICEKLFSFVKTSHYFLIIIGYYYPLPPSPPGCGALKTKVSYLYSVSANWL